VGIVWSNILLNSAKVINQCNHEYELPAQFSNTRINSNLIVILATTSAIEPELSDKGGGEVRRALLELDSQETTGTIDDQGALAQGLPSPS
jgi:hypothetical protein